MILNINNEGKSWRLNVCLDAGQWKVRNAVRSTVKEEIEHLFKVELTSEELGRIHMLLGKALEQGKEEVEMDLCDPAT